MKSVYLTLVLAPLLGAVIAGLFGKKIGRTLSHSVTILGVAVSCSLSVWVLSQFIADPGKVDNFTIYHWLVSEGIDFQIGFLVDSLTVLMITVVTFVSLMVHIYTIGYMQDDPGYQRFFSYIALFTFSMLMLVMANNFLQLFFGWEAVGLVSYLLIGFWFQRDSAVYANLKAFLVNRVGDFGFLLGIAAIFMFTHSLDYQDVFAQAPQLALETIDIIPGNSWDLMTVICLLLFVGAMGKSAQVPLHVWLPDSMEGPTPISALIHAATMVTAGIFMVARMSPLFEWSETALAVVLMIGTITSISMGLVGIVQTDIKRVVAYSTLSQLGYMTVALGVSAYAVAIFHLMTHAFFKALLFLGAGSVIIAMHHEQDMRKMGGLKKYLPITYWTTFIGSLALIGFPFFSGFFSKDSIIEAVAVSNIWGAEFAYMMVLLGVFVTAFYTFRMFYLVFHGPERMDHHTKAHLHESPLVVTIPLILLAIFSVLAGLVIEPLLFGEYFATAITVKPEHNVLQNLEFHSIIEFVWHGMLQPPFALAMAGWFLAWFLYMKRPEEAERNKQKLSIFYNILAKKYGFDEFNAWVFAGGARGIGQLLWKLGDAKLIDGWIVNGSARLVACFSGLLRHIQTGYLYHYAFAMILGLMFLLLQIWYIAPAP